MKKSLSFLALTFLILTGLLNISNKLIICSLIYTCMAMIANALVYLYGKRKSIQVLIVSLMAWMLLSWKISYFIHGVFIPLMMPGSFISVLISIYVGTSLFHALKTRYNFHISNLIAACIASIIDSAVVVGIVLSPKFSTSKLVSILCRDLMFKFGYATMVGVCILLAAYLYGRFFCQSILLQDSLEPKQLDEAYAEVQ